MHTADEIFQAALTLPEEKRLSLIEELFASLGAGRSNDFQERWAVEAEERILAFERGELEAIPGDQVMDGPPDSGFLRVERKADGVVIHKIDRVGKISTRYRLSYFFGELRCFN